MIPARVPHAILLLVLLFATTLASASDGAAATRPRIWTSGRQVARPGVVTSSPVLPKLYISGEGFAVGETVEIAIYDPGEAQARTYVQAAARSNAGFDGGSFGYLTEYSYCEGQPRYYEYELEAIGKRSGARSSIVTVKLCGIVPEDTTLTNSGGWWPLPWP